MQFEKLQRRRQGKWRCPNCFDLVEDKVINRSLYALISFLVFLLIAYNLSIVPSEASPQVSDIQLGVPVPYNAQFQQTLASQRTPTIFLRNKYGKPVVDVQARIILLSFFAPLSDTRPQCNTPKLIGLLNTLEYIRFGELCRMVFKNPTANSNDMGMVTFKNFEIQRGPEGSYALAYQSQNTLSDDEHISITSQVEQLEVNTVPPLVIKVGWAFSPQPELTIRDKNGNPVKGKKVIAFSWVDSHFSPDQYDDVLLIGNKLSLFEGEVSNPSDANGVAKFTDLKVVGTTAQIVHIFFSVDGKIVVPWLYRPLEPPAPGLPVPPQSRWPIFLFSDVTRVQVLKPPPSVVTEGQIWPSQPKVRVVNAQNKPVAGQVVIAIAYGGVSGIPPLGFRNVIKGIPNKKLINPVEGEFANFIAYLEGQQKSFTPLFTDSNGQIQFKYLAFNTLGVASSSAPPQEIFFICNGVLSDISLMNVTSKVANVTLSKKLPSSMKISSSSEYDHILRLRVVDSSGAGVQGKSPMDFSLKVESPNADSDLVVKARTELKQFSISDSQGFMALPIKIYVVKKDSVNATFYITVDNVSLKTEVVTFYGNLQYVPNYCANIEIITAPPGSMKNGVPFTPVYKAVKQDGSPIADVEVTGGVEFKTEYPNKLKRSVINSVDPSAATAKSDSTGTITLTNFKFLHQPTGLIFFLATGRDSEGNTCTSDFSVIFQIDVSSDAELISPNNRLLGVPDQTIPVGTEQPTVIKLTDNKGKPVVGATVTVDIDIAQMPVNLFSEYHSKQNSSVFFTLSSSSLTSDADGNIKFKWKLNKGNVGLWTIIFKLDGGYTPPFTFITEWDSGAKVNIIRQPVASGNQAVGDYLDSNGGPIIEVKDSSNNPLENYMVSTSLIPVNATGGRDYTSNRKEGIIDMYTTTLQDIVLYASWKRLDLIADTFITYTGEKNGRTDANGQVTLNKLTLIDLEGNTPSCFKFIFFIGTSQGGNFTLSAPSQKVCFENKMHIQLRNSPSSKISPNHHMSVPPVIRFTKRNSSDSDRAGLFIFVGVVSEINSHLVSNRFFAQQHYFTNNVCAFYNKTNIVGGCSDLKVINDGTHGNYIAEISFAKLKYMLNDNVVIKARFSTPFQSQEQYIQASGIEVVVEPEALEIVEHPPKQVELNEIFQVKVKATLSNGSPVAFVDVAANITASKKVTSFSEKMFNFAANLLTGINNMNQLSQVNNIRLNPATGSSLTNSDGIATLTLQIISGQPGNYTIVTSSGSKAQSPPSNILTFKNTIGKVTYAQGIQQSHSVQASTSNEQKQYQLTLNPQPVLAMIDENGEKLTTLGRDISVFVISEQDINSAYNSLGVQSGATHPGISQIIQNIAPPTSLLSQALSTITKAWTVFTRGAAQVGASTSNSLSSTAHFSPPTVDSNGNYVFHDLSITVKAAEKYKVIFMVDGIETTPSESIEVIDQETQANAKVRYYVTLVLVILLGLFLLYSAITSNAYTYTRTLNLIYIIISLACCVALFIFILVTNFSLTLSIFLIITIFLVIGSLVYTLVQLFSPKCKKYIFYVEWARASHEYTYQKLFNRPSNKWIAEKGQPAQYQDASQEYQPLNPAQYEEEQKKYKGYGEFQFKKQGFVRRMVQLAVPFQISANRLNIGDCFFFPQRFFIGFMIAFFGFIFIAVNLFQFIVRFRSGVQSVKFNSVETIFNFVRVGVKKIYLWVQIDPDQSNLSIFVDTSQLIEQFLNQLSYSFYVAAIIGTVLATVILLVSMLTLFYDFKKRVLQARTGYWPYPQSKFSIINSTTYVGSLISTFILGYAVIAVLLTFTFIPLCNPITWQVLWTFKWILLGIIAPSLANVLFKLIAGKICVAKTHVRYRRCFAILEIFLLYTAIPSGIITGLVRFILMLVVGILTLSKIDTPIAPMWVMNRLMWVDFPNGSYNALILEHHTHRNPLVTTAMYSFLSCLVPTREGKIESEKEKQDFQSVESRRIAHRFQLLLLLIKNPSLIQYRKRNLIKEKAEASQEDQSGRRSTITDNFKSIEMANMNH